MNVDDFIKEFFATTTDDYDSSQVTVKLVKGTTSVSLTRKFQRKKIAGSGGPIAPPVSGWNYPRIATIYSKAHENDYDATGAILDDKYWIGKFQAYVGDFGWGPDTGYSAGSGPLGLSVGEFINTLQPYPGYNWIYYHSCIWELNQPEPGGNYWRTSETGFYVNSVRYRICLEWLMCYQGTTLSGAINNSTTTVPVADQSKFNVNDYAIIGVPGQPLEMVKVTAKQSSSGAGNLTVLRGQQAQTTAYSGGSLISTTGGNGGYPAISHASGKFIRAVAYAFGSSSGGVPIPSPYWMLNVTANCPTADGGFGPQTANQFEASFLTLKLAETHFTFFDGIFEDNFIDRAVALFDGARTAAAVDYNNTNAASGISDSVWKTGMLDLASNLRTQLGNTKTITANTGGEAVDFSPYFNGGMMEGVDYNGTNSLIGGTVDDMFNWYKSWDPAQTGGLAYGSSPMFLFNASSSRLNGGWRTDYQAMRFTLGLCLLGSGMYIYDEFLDGNPGGGLDSGGHQSAAWYDEYDGHGLGVGWLGQPLSAYEVLATGVYRRKFEHGVVVVNTTASSQTVALGGTYARFSGTQAPTINDGTTGLTSQTLAAKDARLLKV